MIRMQFFRLVLALLGGTHVLCAQPSASPTVKSAGEYTFSTRMYVHPFLNQSYVCLIIKLQLKSILSAEISRATCNENDFDIFTPLYILS